MAAPFFTLTERMSYNNRGAFQRGIQHDPETSPFMADIESQRLVADLVNANTHKNGNASPPRHQQQQQPQINSAGSSLGAAVVATSDYPADGGCIPCCCYRRRVGNVFVLYEQPPNPDGSLNIRLLAPVCWPMMFVSLGLVSTASLLVFRFTLPQLHWAWSVLSFGVLGTFVVSLLLTSLRDFGIFPRYHAPQGSSWNWSLQSQSFRPPGVIFCSESKVRPLQFCTPDPHCGEEFIY